MSTRIYWTPPTVPVSYYDVLSAATNEAELTLATTFQDDREGSNWYAPKKQFFYDDSAGTDRTVYRVKGYDALGLVFDTGVYQPDHSYAAVLATRVRVDHNYGGANALQPVTPSGAPIPQTVVRIYKKPDYDAGRTELALLVTETDSAGRWVIPFWLEPGMTYTLVFEKVGSYGPAKAEITL